MADQVKITLRKSIIGGSPKQKRTAIALGLTKMNKSVLKVKNPSIMGMVNIISHLVEVEETR